jgi:signal transduction histidine kinase
LLDGNGGVLGTFAVYHRAPHRPADRELEVAQVFTNAVAVAIERHGDQLRLVEARLGAEAANRAKSDFIAHMSHELRTPLNAILGFSDAIAADVFGAAGGERYGEYARHIHDSGRLLLGMIDGLLDLARLEAGRYELREESIAVGPLIADCVKLAAPPGTPAPAIDVRLDVGGCRLHADRQAVARILLNLLSNAIKFTPAERSVTVAARCGTDGMTIEVADRGIGIPADSLAHLGTPFHQVNAAVARAARGTGLGLSITRSLVGLHRGTLSIASTVGVGTTVTVRFPADRVEASRPAA